MRHRGMLKAAIQKILLFIPWAPLFKILIGPIAY